MSGLKQYLINLKEIIINCLLDENYTPLNKLWDDKVSFDKDSCNALLTFIKNIEKICETRGRY